VNRAVFEGFFYTTMLQTLHEDPKESYQLVKKWASDDPLKKASGKSSQLALPDSE